MIPLKISIKNFLSYGAETQTIDFSQYPLICFSGKNGHGKSALLDALTWAIWGQARKISSSVKADHNLLRLGQDFMMVSLDFVINNQIYTISDGFFGFCHKQSNIYN
jgi:exonuclease SbcC